jgi:CBS-domain-containing membrane protein
MSQNTARQDFADSIRNARDYLSRIKISDISRKIPQLITASPSDTVSQVLNVLAVNQITSVPVFDNKIRKFIGFVDMLDLTTFVVSSYVEEKTFQIMENKGSLLDEANDFKQKLATPVINVIDASKRDLMLPVNGLESVIPLVENAFGFFRSASGPCSGRNGCGWHCITDGCNKTAGTTP